MLKRQLNRWDSTAIIVGVVIGVGIFRIPDEVGKFLHLPSMILLAWFAGGVISLMGALCYAELSSTFPRTGGNYVYLKESYGPGVAFLFGWTELFVIHTGSIAAVAFILAEFAQSLFNVDVMWVKPIAVLAVVALSAVNILGVDYGKKYKILFQPPRCWPWLS